MGESSRQYNWQKKKQANGCCATCGVDRGASGTKKHCRLCADKYNAWQVRKRREK